MMETQLPTLTCLRCGHSWTPRQSKPPTVCPNPKCKSRYWNRPRRKEEGGTIKREEKTSSPSLLRLQQVLEHEVDIIDARFARFEAGFDDGKVTVEDLQTIYQRMLSLVKALKEIA